MIASWHHKGLDNIQEIIGQHSWGAKYLVIDNGCSESYHANENSKVRRRSRRRPQSHPRPPSLRLAERARMLGAQQCFDAIGTKLSNSPGHSLKYCGGSCEHRYSQGPGKQIGWCPAQGGVPCAYKAKWLGWGIFGLNSQCSGCGAPPLTKQQQYDKDDTTRLLMCRRI